ncbi:DUF885 domain-containing protein [Prosthecobacter sp.]|uniref:DUF885 domain-containing protein n=1 Tax=Prosthecobacter sp. TaxID=1965333 RepID=UPI003783DCFB
MHPTTTFLLLLVFLTVVGPSSAQNNNTTTADAKLESFFKTYLEKTFELRPLDATMLGDHRFDDKLDDISPTARASWLALARQTLAALPQAVPYAQLSRNSQIDFEILRDDLTRSIWLTENTHPFEEDPRTYGSYISDSVYTLLVQSTLPKETNIKNVIARLALIPRIIATARETLQAVPHSILDTAILQNRGAISFYEEELFTLAGSTPQLPALQSAAKPVVAALKEYQTFLESDLRKKATDHWRMGKEKFARKLELELDTGRTADEVLADAEAEYDRVQRDMYIIARQLWSRHFPKTPLPPDDAQGRHDTIAQVIRAVSRDHGTPEALITDTRATVARIKTFIREHDILRLPEPDRCQILEMPEFRRGNSVAYLESALPLDPSGPSTYAVSPPPSDWKPERVQTFLEEYNKHMLQVLTIHEAYPGHYVQLEYSTRCPSLIRQVLQSGTFKEGWAVYTEQMMIDQGYGGGDLSLRLNQLKFYLRAVVNSILDHKMHCTAMTDDEAMHLLTHGAFQSEGEAKLKIIRSKQNTAQLSTYFAGRMAFYRLRQQTQREQGEKFDLGRFHEAAIDHGSLPVKFLPELVRTRLTQPR